MTQEQTWTKVAHNRILLEDQLLSNHGVTDRQRND